MAEEEFSVSPLSMVWKAKCSDSAPSKTLSTWQPIEEKADDIFHAKAFVTSEPRVLDYKSDEGLDLTNNDDSFLSYQNVSLNNDDSSSSKFEENAVESNDSNYSSEMDLSYESALPEGQSGVTDVNTNSVEEDDTINPVAQTEQYTERSREAIAITRRQIVPVRPHMRVVSCPLPVEMDPRPMLFRNSSEEQSVDETTADALKLREVTRTARSFSRPLVRGNAEEHDSDEDVECKTYKFISIDVPNIPPPPAPEEVKEETVKPNNDFQVLTDITAMTRKATRPKIKDLDFKPKPTMKRSKSVMQVSPTVPALSPTGERSPLTKSLSSSSSSSSDYSYAFTYLNDADACFKCGKAVYQLDKVGPIRKVLFHTQCFRCCKCGSALTVKNYFQNFTDKSDKQVYCRNHKPLEGKGSVTLDDKNISVILNHPKLETTNNTIVRGPEEDRNKRSQYGFREAVSMPKLDIVCKQWDEVNRSFMDRLEETTPRGRHDVLKLTPSEARSVWSRSAMGAASLDFGTPNPRRNIHHFYQNARTGSAWNYM